VIHDAERIDHVGEAQLYGLLPQAVNIEFAAVVGMARISEVRISLGVRCCENLEQHVVDVGERVHIHTPTKLSQSYTEPSVRARCRRREPGLLLAPNRFVDRRGDHQHVDTVVKRPARAVDVVGRRGGEPDDDCCAW
jgi:hypothetical protein